MISSYEDNYILTGSLRNTYLTWPLRFTYKRIVYSQEGWATRISYDEWHSPQRELYTHKRHLKKIDQYLTKIGILKQGFSQRNKYNYLWSGIWSCYKVAPYFEIISQKLELWKESLVLRQVPKLPSLKDLANEVGACWNGMQCDMRQSVIQGKTM